MSNLYKALGISPVTLQPTEFANLKSYQDYLVRTHLGLVDYLETKLMIRFPNNRLCQGDLASAGYEALLNAARTYKPSGKPFLPYAYSTIKNAMYAEIRDLFPVDLKSSYKSEEGFNYELVFCDSAFDSNETLGYDCNADDEEQQRGERFDMALERLAPVDRNIIESHYGINCDAMTFEQLGQQYNVSLQAIGKREKRILKLLRADLSKCA